MFVQRVVFICIDDGIRRSCDPFKTKQTENTDYKGHRLYLKHMGHHTSPIIYIQYHQVIHLLSGHVTLETDQQGDDNDDADLKRWHIWIYVEQTGRR